MGPLTRGLFLSACFSFALGFSADTFAQDRQPAGAADQNVEGEQPAATTTNATTELPDSPGTEWAKLQATSPAQDNQQQSTTPAQSTAQPSEGQDQKPQRPVGTAAAEAPKVSGVTAAEPAGVAIAPAKQRRVRTIVLKVGAIIGAGAALGTVIALTEATPSKPPGAH
jgi:hypothetical protein